MRDRDPQNGMWLVVAFVYVASALIADTLVLNSAHLLIDWGRLRWQFHGMDLFKFIAWFVVPVAIAASRLEIEYFTFRRWKRADWILLGVILAGGALTMIAIPFLQGVGEYYHGWGSYSVERRRDLAQTQVLWTFSWLLGWEFMHRYWLPKSFLDAFPERGWIAAIVVIPVFEALYHVAQGKPGLESLGMGALSVVFCAWALRRRNSLLPFLGHLAIELELVTFLYFTK